VKRKAAITWRRFLRKLRTIIIAGLVVTVPLGITIWIFIWLFNTIDKFLQPIIIKIFGEEIVGFGFAVIVVLVLIFGIIATNVVGNRILHWGESMLARVPVIRTIYSALRQVAQSFSNPQKPQFLHVVLIEFPAKGMRTIAFITSEETDKQGEKYFNVFIPTAINPTGGFIEIVREKDIIRTNLTVEEGLKMAVSAGSMSPRGLDDSMAASSKEKTKELDKEDKH
jgi:uncharacterized membrane protein